MDHLYQQFLPPLFNSGLVFGVNRNQAIALAKNRLQRRVLINQQLTMHRPIKILIPALVSVEQIGKLSAVALIKSH